MGKTHLEHNIAVHNKIAKRYEAIHGEIYNEVEQGRLKGRLEDAVARITTGSSKPTVLDFGCGAGNLTKHLTDLGCEVVAADISKGFLDLVASRTYQERVKTVQLNGVDLSTIESSSLDMVAMYSVLHHVPDYLSLMKEFSRVLKKGGILYIDHEASHYVWGDSRYLQFEQEMKSASRLDIKKYLYLPNYIDRLIRMFINPKYQREGDIHVFSDDHIEWGSIRERLSACGVTVVHEEDYLLFRKGYDQAIYEAWKNKVGDMHLLVGKKEI